MAQAALYNMAGDELGSIELEDSVFGIEPNRAVMHEAVVAHLRNCRQGTSSTKGRSDVRGGGKKPWRQKGTGHARQGSTRAPHWRHGGAAPTPREFERTLPQKVSKLARRSALSAKLADGELKVIDSIQAEAIKTKAMAASLAALGQEPSTTTLIVLPLNREDRAGMEKVYLSCRNLPNVTVRTTENLSAYELIRHRNVLLDQNALPRILEVLQP